MAATTLNVGIIRPGSPPLNVNLAPSHLPADVRRSLETLAHAHAAAAEAEKELAGVRGEAWHAANAKAETARQAAGQAMQEFAALNAASSTAIRDSAQAAFNQAIDRVNTALQQAADGLAEAGQAAALFHSVTPGKPVVRTDTRRANEAPVRHKLAMARSYLNDARSFVPEDLDG
ncbi:hypothetical protein ABZX99_02970 [Streptomyces antibioticus]|uniref:hypothetical protein n=2 Tax=Streptomyces TaxID=1883 RepID=UPI00339F2E4D